MSFKMRVFNFENKIESFLKLLCSWIIFCYGTLIFNLKTLANPDKLIMRDIQVYDYFWEIILVKIGSPELFIASLLVLLSLSIFLIWKGTKLFLILAIYFLIQNINFYIYPVIDSGHHLLNLFLIYYIIYSVLGGLSRKPQSWKKFLFYILQFQIILMYFSAAINKLKVSKWLESDLNALVLSYPRFSTGLSETIANNFSLSFLGGVSIGVVFYQLFFGVNLFLKKTYWFFLIFGLGFHLTVLGLLGVTNFSLISIISLYLFVSSEDEKLILNKFKKIFGANRAI